MPSLPEPSAWVAAPDGSLFAPVFSSEDMEAMVQQGWVVVRPDCCAQAVRDLAWLEGVSEETIYEVALTRLEGEEDAGMVLKTKRALRGAARPGELSSAVMDAAAWCLGQSVEDLILGIVGREDRPAWQHQEVETVVSQPIEFIEKNSVNEVEEGALCSALFVYELNYLLGKTAHRDYVVAGYASQAFACLGIELDDENVEIVSINKVEASSGMVLIRS